MKRRWLVSFGVAVIALAMTGGAFAQGEADPKLEEVLVTAQKKEQDLQKVPSSVAALSDEKLDVLTSGGQDIRLLSGRVPSLLIESSFGRTFPRFYIRGLGNTDFDLNASQPVSLVYDEVVLENPILKGFPIFDMQRVEVLRGPQGTLFGRNTPAGIVKFESRKPTHELDAFGRVSYGRYNTVQFEGAVGGPLAEDVLAGRASFLYQGRSDWVNNTFTGEENALGSYQELAGRVQVLFTPDDKFSALLNGHLRDLDGTATLFRANVVASGSDEIVSRVERDKIGIDGINKQELQSYGGVAKLNYDFDATSSIGAISLTSVTGYDHADLFSRGDIDGGSGADFLPGGSDPPPIPFDAQTADAVPNLDQFSEEIRVASNNWDQVNFQAGFFYFKEDVDIESFNFATFDPGQPQNGFSKQRQETTAWAVFGAMDVDVTEQFNASAGVRYSDDQKDLTAELVQPLPFPGAAGRFPAGTMFSTSPTADFVSWDVNGLYAVNDDVNLYGRVARSFRAPSIQGRILFGDSLGTGFSEAGTEKILSLEAGTKSTLLNNRARANVSVFYYMMDDQQLTAVGGVGNVNTLLNADKTTGVGFEVDLDFLPHDQVLITAGGSYNRTEIDDPTLGVAPGGAAGLTVLDDPIPGSPGIVSIHKNSLPNAPEWVFNGTARASMPLGKRGEAFLYTDWAYRSEVSFFLYESVEFTEKNLVEGGVRVGYTTFERDYEISVFGRNITNDLSRTGGIDFNNLTGFLNEPFTWGVEIRRSL